MKLEALKLGPGDKVDQLTFVRADGSASRITLPRQGILPHDLLHFVVESALPFRHGFLSMVADGADATFAMSALHAADAAVRAAEGAQVEALVEALQTQLWAGGFDAAAFLDGVTLACESRGVASPALGDVDFEAVLFDRAIDLNAQWAGLAPKQSMTLVFERRGQVA